MQRNKKNAKPKSQIDRTCKHTPCTTRNSPTANCCKIVMDQQPITCNTSSTTTHTRTSSIIHCNLTRCTCARAYTHVHRYLRFVMRTHKYEYVYTFTYICAHGASFCRTRQAGLTIDQPVRYNDFCYYEYLFQHDYYDIIIDTYYYEFWYYYAAKTVNTAE